jgi:hypothetical protein
MAAVLFSGLALLGNHCSLEGALPNLDSMLNPQRGEKNAEHTNTGQYGSPQEGEQAKPTATFDLRVADPNKIEGRYHAEKEDWWHKFLCDIKIGEVLLAVFTLLLFLYTARLYWATDKLADADRPHVLADKYSLAGLRNTDPAVTTVNVSYAFKNHGKSPAFCEMLTVDLMTVKNGAPPKKPTYTHRRPNFLILGPGIPMVPSGGTRAEIPFTLEERQAVIGGTATLYVSGRIEYRDALRKPHKSRFLYILRLGSNEVEDFFEAVGPRSYWTYT